MKTINYDRFVLMTGLMPDVLARDLLTKKQVVEGLQLSKDDYLSIVNKVDFELRHLYGTCSNVRKKLNHQWVEQWISDRISCL